MEEKWKKFLICLFGGIFGIHKFLEGNIGMGILYLFTGGLFCIGWIIDLINILTDNYATNGTRKSLMTRECVEKINNGELPRINVSNINLAEDEICHFVDSAYTYKDKTYVAGYKGNGVGASFKFSKNVSIRTGKSGSEAIRNTERTTYNGVLALTNKRIIFICANDGFDKKIDKITSIMKTNEGISVQIGSEYYNIGLKTNNIFMKALNLVKNNNI